MGDVQKLMLPGDMDFEKYLDTSSPDIRGPQHWKDDLDARFDDPDFNSGDVLPWQKTAAEIQFRDGELTIWAGYSGHGKSMVTGQAALWFMAQRKRVCIASMEMMPVATLQRLARQASGLNHPSKQYRHKIIDWLTGKLWIYDRYDQVALDNILGMIAYCHKELDINHVFVDSLMKCGVAGDDLSKQREFVDSLCQTAKKYKIHIHLVAHMKKAQDEYTPPNKFDVSGSADITNLADNVIVVHTNKAKQEKVKTGQEYDERERDATLAVRKQRHGEFEENYTLWFHNPSQQFIPRQGGGAMPFPFDD